VCQKHDNIRIKANPHVRVLGNCSGQSVHPQCFVMCDSGSVLSYPICKYADVSVRGTLFNALWPHPHAAARSERGFSLVLEPLLALPCGSAALR